MDLSAPKIKKASLSHNSGPAGNQQVVTQAFEFGFLAANPGA
jgi:hypothetical protein